VKTFALNELGRGISAAIAEPDGVAVGNAGFVDLGGEVLVFDTTVSLTAGRELRAAAERKGRIARLVYSHWHGDHVFGAGAMPAAALVVATSGTAALLEERAAPRLRELKADAANITEGPFAELARAELPQVEIVFPDETFADEQTFAGEKRTARALTFGGGHTMSDAVLWLEEERILFAADLVVVGTHPWVGDGDVGAWREILGRLADLDPATVVPGHGPVAGPEALEFVHDYLDALEGAEPGAPVPERFDALAAPGVWLRNLEALAAREPA
jgi:glyoxylase-like metal-dependent hydrolase (beta-lactamase superfamily II)